MLASSIRAQDTDSERPAQARAAKAAETTLEAEAMDSVSGERIFAVIVSGRGSSFDPLTVEDRWENAMKVSSGFGKFIGQKMKEAHASD